MFNLPSELTRSHIIFGAGMYLAIAFTGISLDGLPHGWFGFFVGFFITFGVVQLV